MKLQTDLCDKLQITHPIIQAGMAGGPTTVDLVVSVSEAGGLGSFGASYMTPDAIRQAIRETKERTAKPFAVNLFCTDMKDSFEGADESQQVLDELRNELGIERSGKRVETKDLFNQQFQVLIEEKVPVISTAFGVLPPDKTEVAKQHNMKITAMVTTVDEAKLAEKSGADIIIAQGSDAGGHRGTFHLDTHQNGANIGTFSLVPQVVDAVSLPVVAAGGIMDGRGLVAALALGASGIQMGTAFLPAIESGAHRVFKEALLKSTEESTVVTKVFSGRPARGIKNRFVQYFDERGVSPAAFPTQNSMTSDIRKEAAKQNNPEFMSLWAGQATRLLRKDASAGRLIQSIIEEAEQLLRY
ncbi:nitronate monooxygenase [Peribacillus cavernae]|uniref:Probable nitronate monooxygenase n=1 Tax=Peribacillus cavernae TaxID=1674310 RepID=A0A433HJ42_9BACI|nr:nitronate monooxygenase [Peribacillus cavernae]MDQ0217821.1 nitronate monooxygenase [Peribacillus cavernae]RUQ28269.1 nitronate monooxygenase [Peribacillus cavernae]